MRDFASGVFLGLCGISFPLVIYLMTTGGLA